LLSTFSKATLRNFLNGGFNMMHTLNTYSFGKI